MLWSELFFKQIKFLKEKIGSKAAEEWDFWEHEGTDTESEHKRYKEYEKILTENGLGPNIQSWIDTDGYEYYMNGTQVKDENGNPIFHEWAKKVKEVIT